MRILLCILFSSLLSSFSQGLPPVSDIRKPYLDTIGKSLRRMIEYNIDVLYDNDSVLVAGWMIAKEKMDGSTEYRMICMDTARERKFSIYSKYNIKVHWQQRSNHSDKNTVVIQPFTVAGVEAGDLSSYKDLPTGDKLHVWLSNQHGVITMFLNPFLETVIIKCIT